LSAFDYANFCVHVFTSLKERAQAHLLTEMNLEPEGFASLESLSNQIQSLNLDQLRVRKAACPRSVWATSQSEPQRIQLDEAFSVALVVNRVGPQKSHAFVIE